MTTNNSWLWATALGLLAVVSVGAFFLVRQTTGGGGNSCDTGLPKSDSTSISAQAFADQDAALKDVVNTLNAGDRASAEVVFFGPVGSFTYAVLIALSENDSVAADDMCQWIIRVEDGFSRGASNSSVAVSIDHLRGLLRDAAVAFGYPRPGP